MQKKTSKPNSFNKKAIEKAVSGSSKLEGLSFARAKKNKSAIKLLQQYGRAFSV